MQEKINLWFIAARPWSYTAAIIPVSLGAVLAYAEESQFRGLLFFLTLLGGICLQAGVNFLNTYGDFVSGLDDKDHASCPQLVKGEIVPKKILAAGVVSLLLGVLSGVYPVLCGGIPVLVCGFIGVVGASSYTTGIFPYKYVGLGSIMVFFLMGALMVIPSWYIQGAHGVWVPLFGSLPISFLVMAIMHGNEIRDIEHDKQCGISTLAMKMGLRRAIIFYKSLYVLAYLSTAVLVICRVFSAWALLVYLLLPGSIKDLKNLNTQTDSEFIRKLAKKTGKFHFLFGFLLVIGIWIGTLLN